MEDQKSGTWDTSTSANIAYSYLPQTKFEKVMFSQVSVCPRGDLCQGLDRDTSGQRPPWTETLLDRDPLDGDCPLTETPLDIVPPLDRASPLDRDPPCTETHLDSDPPYGNVRAVCILLECILVMVIFTAGIRSFNHACLSVCLFTGGGSPCDHYPWRLVSPHHMDTSDSLPTTWTQPLHIMASGRLAFD